MPPKGKKGSDDSSTVISEDSSIPTMSSDDMPNAPDESHSSDILQPLVTSVTSVAPPAMSSYPDLDHILQAIDRKFDEYQQLNDRKFEAFLHQLNVSQEKLFGKQAQLEQSLSGVEQTISLVSSRVDTADISIADVISRVATAETSLQSLSNTVQAKLEQSLSDVAEVSQDLLSLKSSLQTITDTAHNIPAQSMPSEHTSRLHTSNDARTRYSQPTGTLNLGRMSSQFERPYQSPSTFEALSPAVIAANPTAFIVQDCSQFVRVGDNRVVALNSIAHGTIEVTDTNGQVTSHTGNFFVLDTVQPFIIGLPVLLSDFLKPFLCIFEDAAHRLAAQQAQHEAHKAHLEFQCNLIDSLDTAHDSHLRSGLAPPCSTPSMDDVFALDSFWFNDPNWGGYQPPKPPDPPDPVITRIREMVAQANSTPLAALSHEPVPPDPPPAPPPNVTLPYQMFSPEEIFSSPSDAEPDEDDDLPCSHTHALNFLSKPLAEAQQEFRDLVPKQIDPKFLQACPRILDLLLKHEHQFLPPSWTGIYHDDPNINRSTQSSLMPAGLHVSRPC